MAWTSPRTWVAGEVLTAALLNVHLRDNLKAIGDPWTAWTPTISASAGTFTTVTGAGKYVQQGKTVHWSLTITITTVGTASGYVQFDVPAPALAGAGGIGYGTSTVAGSPVGTQVFLNSSTVARVARYDAASLIGAGNVLRISGSYEAA